MSLHNEIMNIQTKEKDLESAMGCEARYAYRLGHRDARHAAAELSLKSEARIEALEEILRWYVEEDEINEWQEGNEYWVEGKHKAMRLLGMEIEE